MKRIGKREEDTINKNYLLKRDGFVSASVRYITVFEVRGERDTTEGKGGTYSVGYYTDKVQANEAAQRKGVWDQPGYVEELQFVELSFPDGSVNYYVNDPAEVNIIPKKELRDRALAKLTEADKKVLGLI